MPFDGVRAAELTVGRAWRAGLAPAPKRGPAEWADAERVLGTEEGPFPGPWVTDRTPYAREPMAMMALTCRTLRVSLKWSAQIAKTQCTLNLQGQIIAEQACPVLVVLPSIDEARAYNRDKLQPMIDNTPGLTARVVDSGAADRARSTTAFKRFPGGSIELTGANSSKGLQMRTKRVVIMDEVSEFPWDVDGRGDPVEMAEKRAMAYGRRAKIIKASTPAVDGACRISAEYDAGSGGVFMVPCPHCGERQELKFERLVYDPKNPVDAQYACEKCGALCRESDKPAMLAGGVWVHQRPELLAVHASYRLSTLYSPFVTWAWVATEREKSRDDPLQDKVFTQQVLGLAWKQKYDVVPFQVLWERRTEYPSGRIPPTCLFIEGSTDVQGDRLEWAVYGFDRHFGQWWIDGGVLMGDPSEPGVWAEHDRLLSRQWIDAWGRAWPVESWGIDSGYLSHQVYRYVRRHASRGQPRVMALDGRPKWGEPPIGTPKAVDIDYLGKKIGSVLLWPVGTWDLKGEVTGAMMATQEGPDQTGAWPRGCMRFPTRLDIGFFEQLTAETLVSRRVRNGYEVREWIKTRARNEQFDLAVYARALARHDTAGFTDQGWDRLVARRQSSAEPDLIALMQGGVAVEAVVEAAAPVESANVPAPAPPRRATWLPGRGNWL